MDARGNRHDLHPERSGSAGIISVGQPG